MTEYVDSMEIYVTTSVSPGASQSSLLTRFNSNGQGNLAMGIKASPGGDLALYLPFGASTFKTFSHQTKYTLGFRLNMSCIAGVGGGDHLVGFMSCHQILASLRVNADGSILVFGNGLSSTVICANAAAGLVSAATDCYVEFVCIATDTGTDINVASEVWIDDVMVASGNADIGRNKNTLVSQRADFNCIEFNSGVATNGQAYFWDVYLTNGSGATNTGRLGSNVSPFGIIARPILPDADSATIQYTPLSGSVHFSEINELPADGDTSYNGATASGKIDSLGWQPIPTFNGTVKSVQISLCQRSTEEGTAVTKANIGAAGAEEKSSAFGLCSSYFYQHQAFDLDPATAAPWTQPNFNAKLFGYELT